MNRYGKLNLFPGEVKADQEGNIRFERGSVTILRGTETSKGWMETPHGGPWLIVARGSYWPVMVQLDERDIEQLRTGLGRLR